MPEGINKIWQFFKPSFVATNHGLTQFREEWGKLSEEAKTQIRKGIEDGSFTY